MEIRTAGGEVFHNVNEMLKSENKYVRALARSFLAYNEKMERRAAQILNDAFSDNALPDNGEGK